MPKHVYAGRDRMQMYGFYRFATQQWNKEGGQHHAPAALPSGKNRYSFDKRPVGLRSRSVRRRTSCSHRDSILPPSNTQQVTVAAMLFRSLLITLLLGRTQSRVISVENSMENLKLSQIQFLLFKYEIQFNYKAKFKGRTK
jgi:hypothetical protein